MDDLALTHIEPAQIAEALADDPTQFVPVVENHFAPGLYGRKVTLPAGTLAVGKKHKTTHLSILAKGHLVVRGVNGLPDHHMHAGDVMVTPAGSQRAVIALEETVFVCVHFNPDNETDLAELEHRMIEAPALGYDGGVPSLG